MVFISAIVFKQLLGLQSLLLNQCLPDWFIDDWWVFAVWFCPSCISLQWSC